MYQKLREAIDNIWIIDNHGHPGITIFNDNSPIPKEEKIPFRDEFKSPKMSSSGYKYVEDAHYEAYKKLYGWSREYLDNPDNLEEIKRVYNEKRLNVRSFIDIIMEKAKVEHLMGNFWLPDELKNKNSISLVPGIDGLLFPFDNSYMFNRQFSKQYLREFEYALSIMKKRFGPLKEDFTLDEYLEFVDNVLEGFKNIDKAPALKFGVAYARSLYFPNVDNKDPKALLEGAKSGDTKAYDDFQSFIFWHIMRKLAKIDLPVQIHTAVTDAFGDYFNPKNLEGLLRDKECYNTKIVLLHAGYPHYDDAMNLALYANVGLLPNQVYIDISGRIMFGMHPKIIGTEIAKWLKYPPIRGKILYGSDVLLGERYIYTAAKAGRDAVYFALESVLNEGIIENEEEAIKIAKDILRNNAIRLYKLSYDII